MKNKKLKILFLYPNLNMSTLVPNAISIFTAVLKQAGFNNIDLFDTIELTRKLKCTDINAFTFAPYHGTSLRGLCERKNCLDKDTLGHIYFKDSLLTMPSISKVEIHGLMKTFILYSRLPRSYWKDIKIAETESEEGINKYAELVSTYKRDYLRDVVARD